MSIEEVAAKKVLLIVRDFPPFCPSVGSALRAIKLVAWLKLQGLEPVVLHARAPEGEFFGYEALLRGAACFSEQLMRRDVVRSVFMLEFFAHSAGHACRRRRDQRCGLLSPTRSAWVP